MKIRTASCRCGQLTAVCTGEPVRVSVCHCHNCQKRSGSAFAAQARWPDAHVAISGDSRTWEARGDSGGLAVFRFCPVCGSTLAYGIESMPGVTAIAMGAFAGTDLPAPQYSVYEGRKLAWIEITGDMEHFE
jgi:hypothetical protein